MARSKRENGEGEDERDPEAEIAELRSDLSDTRADLRDARADRDEAREEIKRLRDELQSARLERDACREEAQQLRSQIRELETKAKSGGGDRLGYLRELQNSIISAAPDVDDTLTALTEMRAGLKSIADSVALLASNAEESPSSIPQMAAAN